MRQLLATVHVWVCDLLYVDWHLYVLYPLFSSEWLCSLWNIGVPWHILTRLALWTPFVPIGRNLDGQTLLARSTNMNLLLLPMPWVCLTLLCREQRTFWATILWMLLLVFLCILVCPCRTIICEHRGVVAVPTLNGVAPSRLHSRRKMDLNLLVDVMLLVPVCFTGMRKNIL